MPPHSWYEIFRDQGSIIAGVLALIAGLLAGVLAYGIGWQQVKVLREQNHLLRREKRRDLAREALKAARLFNGILERVAANVKRLDGFGSGNQILQNTANSIRQLLEEPPLYPMMEYLAMLSREVIDGYYLLVSKIDDFRKPAGIVEAGALHTELQGISTVVNFLLEEVSKEQQRAEQLLRDTQE